MKKNKKDDNPYLIKKSDKPIDVLVKKKSNSKKINKIIDDNIEGNDDYGLLSDDEINNFPTEISDNDVEGGINLLTNKKLYDKFRNLMKADIIKEVTNLSRQLTPNDILIAKAMSEGMSEEELMNLFNVDYSFLDQLRSNPNFLTELQRFTQTSAFGNKNNRIQKLSRLAGMMYQDLIDNPEQISAMHPSQKMKAISDITNSLNKMQEEDNISSNKDITVIIKERRIDEGRIIKGEDGKIRVKPLFPTINNNTGKVES